MANVKLIPYGISDLKYNPHLPFNFRKVSGDYLYYKQIITLSQSS